MSPTSFHCSTPRAAPHRGESVILGGSNRPRQADGGPYLKRPPRLASILRLMSSRRSSLVFKNFESFSSKIGSAPSGSSRFPRPPRRDERGNTRSDERRVGKEGRCRW